jgi:hypothetical protein
MATNAFGQTQYGSNAIGGGGGGAAERERRRRRRRRNNNNGGGGLAGGGAAAGGEAPADDPNDGMTEVIYDPFTMSSTGSLTNPVTADNSYGNTGANPLDTGVGSNAFNKPEYRNQAAWGLLNQAGITNDGSGDAMFVDDLVNNWANQYDALSLTENPNLTYENFLYGLVGDSPEATVTTPIGPAPVAATPLGFEEWRRANVDGKWNQMNKNRRQRIRDNYNTYTTDFVGGVNNAPVAASGAPGTEAWRQQVYYPTMNEEIQRALARATPSRRGRETSRWTGTGTTVAFG